MPGALYASATLIDDDTILLAGNAVNLYRISTASVAASAAENAYVARSSYTATTLNDGRVLFAGGFGAEFNIWTYVDIYDPGTDGFTVTGELLSN